MAEALIRIKDIGTAEKPEIELEVKFSPEIKNDSPAHQLVADIVKMANMQQVETAAG